MGLRGSAELGVLRCVRSSSFRPFISLPAAPGCMLGTRRKSETGGYRQEDLVVMNNKLTTDNMFVALQCSARLS